MKEVFSSNETNIKRFHALISGKVQGVFFRVYTQKNAEEKGLSGWVRNTEDGRVEVIAEGETDSLKGLLKLLNQGPPNSYVKSVEVEWLEPKGDAGYFYIKN